MMCVDVCGFHGSTSKNFPLNIGPIRRSMRTQGSLTQDIP
jgi:hypothetical protein